LVQVRAGRAGQLAEHRELGLSQRACGLGDQPGHRDEVLAEPAQRGLAAVTPGHRLRRRHRVQPAPADLVGPRDHADGVHRGRPGHPLVAERLQELRVRRVQLTHQVDHRVRLGRGVVVGIEETQGASRDLGGQRGRSGGVDQGGGAQALRRPVDDHPGHGVGRVSVQVDEELSVTAVHR
jgi:hypothetical protein